MKYMPLIHTNQAAEIGEGRRTRPQIRERIQPKRGTFIPEALQPQMTCEKNRDHRRAEGRDPMQARRAG